MNEYNRFFCRDKQNEKNVIYENLNGRDKEDIKLLIRHERRVENGKQKSIFAKDLDYLRSKL